jgi:hypothetical protein
MILRVPTGIPVVPMLPVPVRQVNAGQPGGGRNMTIVEILLVLLVLAALAAGGWYFMRAPRRKELSGRFGPEYVAEPR